MAAPQLTLEQAKSFLDETIGIFDEDDNRARLIQAIKECGDEPAKKMTVVMPLIQELTGPTLEKYGFAKQAVMQAVMAVQMHAMKDPSLQAKCSMLQKRLMGQME